MDYSLPWSLGSEPGKDVLSIVDATGAVVLERATSREQRRDDVRLLTTIIYAVNASGQWGERMAALLVLVEALRPVAAIADAYPDSYPDRAIGWELVTAGGERLRLTLGDARKAAAALRAVEGEEATP